ncbi:MAG: polypeptide deformylase [Candidatus Taylorbacteria bacterium]|nr:polypeptide deformylase [Candidatus Taylorbacteria bacterium]
MSKKLKIVELGDKILRTKAKAVSVKGIKSKKFQGLIDNMIKTCDLNDGVGIAAPQVNEGLRLFILWSKSNKRYKKVPSLGPIAIINPRIVSSSKKITKAYEGCLSIPGIRGLVPRHKSIDVEFITREGEELQITLEDFPARIFQHEYDHLNGIVFLDRTDPKDLVTEKEYQRILKM